MGLTISGLTGYTHKLATRLASGPAEAELRALHHSIAAASRRLEISLNLKRVSPAQLTAKSRALRGWLAFLADEGSLAGYAHAVRTATRIIDAAMAQQSRFTPPARLCFLPLRGLYRLRQTRAGPLEIYFPTPAITFSDDDFLALARCCLHRDPRSKRHVLGAMRSEAYVALAAELEALAGIIDEARGAHHDLGDSFERVVARYFPNGIPKPKLYWSRSLTHRKFGHYDWVGDAIMISRTLDAAAVPEYVLDFVIYHELLHKSHGLRWSGSRSYAHTAAFYRDERKFAQYTAAEAALEKLAKAMRARR